MLKKKLFDLFLRSSDTDLIPNSKNVSKIMPIFFDF